MKNNAVTKKKWEKPTIKTLSFRNTFGGFSQSTTEDGAYHPPTS